MAVGEERITTPTWARRRLFAKASPEVLLVDTDGGFVTGRDLYGQKRLIVLFDWAAGSDRQNGALTMKMLQKAQADFTTAGIGILFAQVTHPQRPAFLPMDDVQLRQFFEANQLSAEEGGPLPPPPLYRMPTQAERERALRLGLERKGESTYYEWIGQAPNIFVLDEHGLIRWHSAGPVPDPTGTIANDMVYTMNEALLFAIGER